MPCKERCTNEHLVKQNHYLFSQIPFLSAITFSLLSSSRLCWAFIIRRCIANCLRSCNITKIAVGHIWQKQSLNFLVFLVFPLPQEKSTVRCHWKYLLSFLFCFGVFFFFLLCSIALVLRKVYSSSHPCHIKQGYYQCKVDRLLCFFLLID